MSTVPDSLTSGSDIIATYDVEAVGLTLTGNVAGVKGIFTGSLNATAAALTGDLSAVDLVASGCVYTPSLVIDAAGDTALPTIAAASYAPGATNYAWPGSIWILTTVSGAVGSTVANAAWYMNSSASGATGSSWTLLTALVS
jgi:hypothetical protein